MIRGGEHLRDVGVHFDEHGVPFDHVALPPQLPQQLVGHGPPRLGVALALTVFAGLGQRVQERFARSLAGHLDQTQLGDASNRRL